MSVTAMTAPTQPGVRDLVSEAEWQTRMDLAALIRLMVEDGLSGLSDTQVSARVPGEPDRLLVNPADLMFEEVTASNLLKVDSDGTKVLESPHSALPAAYAIHAAIYAARPDVNCIAHTNTTVGEAFSSVETDLLPLAQSSMYLYNRCGHHPFEDPASNLDEPERLVRSLGSNRGLILHNRGLMAAAPTIPATWAMIYQLERICAFQLQAMTAANTSGQTLKMIPQDVAEKTVAGFDQHLQRCADGEYDFDWPAYLTALDRVDESYRL